MIQVLSVIGAIFILAGYAGVQTRRLEGGSVAFSLINAIGAGLLLLVAIVEDQVGFIILEVVWLLVSLAGIARALTAQRA